MKTTMEEWRNRYANHTTGMLHGMDYLLQTLDLSASDRKKMAQAIESLIDAGRKDRLRICGQNPATFVQHEAWGRYD